MKVELTDKEIARLGSDRAIWKHKWKTMSLIPLTWAIGLLYLWLIPENINQWLKMVTALCFAVTILAPFYLLFRKYNREDKAFLKQLKEEEHNEIT